MKRRPAHSAGLTDEDRQIVERALTGPVPTARARERLEMVKGAALGWSVAEIMIWSGRCEKTVRSWIAVYQAEGVAGLADGARPGRPVHANRAYLDALATAVDTNPRSLEQGFDVWTSGRLSAYLAATTGVRIAPGWLRVLLHRERFANGRPKHSVTHLQDEAEVETCKERLREVGGKGGGKS